MPAGWVWVDDYSDSSSSSSSILWWYYLVIAILVLLILALISFIVWWCRRLRRSPKIKRYVAEPEPVRPKKNNNTIKLVKCAPFRDYITMFNEINEVNK